MLPVLLASLLMGADAPKYAKPELLVEPAQANAKDFLILDTRSAAKFEAGHVPGAVNVSIKKWADAVNAEKADAAYWKKELADVGVSPKVPVLLYSDDLRESARGWWLLKLAGVPDARLLNGGWQAYEAEKLATSKERIKPMWVEPFDWKPEPRLALKAEVVKDATAKSAVLIDARSADEFSKGRVPGAKPLEWTELIDDKSKKFKPAGELIKLLDEKKIDLSKPCVTYCAGGGRAAVMAFGLELMGAKDVRNYHKSWGEYGSDEKTPKEK